METEYDLELESNLAATVRTSASVHGVHTLPAELPGCPRFEIANFATAGARGRNHNDF